MCCAGTHDDQRRRLDVDALRRHGGGDSTSCQRVLAAMGSFGHGDVQGALDIDLSIEIEEPGDGASRQPLISPQFICSIVCA